MSEKFTCSACGKTYDKGRTDDEAESESKLIWGDIPEEDLCVICDDCFTGGNFAGAYAEHTRGQKSN